MQSVRDLEFILEKSFDLEQLAQVSLTLHQGKVLFDVIEYVRNTPGVQIAEIQIEWEAPVLFLSLIISLYCSKLPDSPSIVAVDICTGVVSTDFKKSS